MGTGIIAGDGDRCRTFKDSVLRNDDNELYLKETHDARLILNIGSNSFAATIQLYVRRHCSGEGGKLVSIL
jgi:hypothetical protein